MKKLRFKIHLPDLLKEITDCALPQKMGVLRVPMNELRNRLIELSQIAIETQEPKLMLWCYDMTLFDEADPNNKNYNPKLREQILKMIEENENARKTNKKTKRLYKF